MNGFITAVSGEANVPINVIQAIIAAIMQIIAGCTPAPSVPEVKAGSMRWNVTVYRALISNGIRPLSKTGQDIQAAMYKHAQAVTDADALDFLTQCGVTPP